MKAIEFNNLSMPIRQAIDLEVSFDVPEELHGKLIQLSQLIGSSAELKANAKEDLKRAELLAFLKYKGEKLTPTMMKVVIEGECAEYYGRLEYADRLNSGLVHCMESLRTLISAKKEELRQSNFQV